jgi:hypothetical protein
MQLLSSSKQSEAKTLAQADCPQADLDRKQNIKLAWKAYRGELQDPLKVKRGESNDNVKTNRCAPVVDKGVSFLFGPVLGIEATDEASQPDTDKQECLDGTWGDDDEKMTLLCKMATNGGVCGQIFLKLIPPQGSSLYPRLVVLDPSLIRIVTPPDDCDLILAYIIEYAAGKDEQKRQIIARVDPDSDTASVGPDDIADTWTISNYVKRGQSTTWTSTGETEDWPYPFAPIFTTQNLPNPNEPWGVPDLTPDLIAMNNVLNFVQSNTARIIKYHAHPKTIARGVHADQVTVSPDDILFVPSMDSDIKNLEMESDLSSSLNFASVLRTDMDEQSRVPAVALGRLQDMPRGDVTGIALQLMFQPLLEKTTLKRRTSGSLIRAVSRAILVIMGKISIDEYENYPIGLHWAELLPTDALKSAQTALLYRQLSVSDATLLKRLGFDPEEEAEKLAQEDARKATMYAQGRGFPALPPAQDEQQAEQEPAMAGGKQ